MARQIMLLPYAAGTLAVLFWGATPAVTALIVRDIPSFVIGPARLLLSAALLIPFMLFARPKLPNDREGWIALGTSGLVGFGASFLCQGLGIARTTTSHAALILALAPVLTAFFQFVQSRNWPRNLWWLGSAVALAGEATLIFSRNAALGGSTATVLGDVIVFIGTVTVSIGYVAGAKLSSKIGLFGATAWAIVFGAMFMLPAVPVLIEAAPALTLVGGSALAFLAIVCTLVGFAAWFWALGHGEAGSITLLQFAQPMVGIIIAAIFLSEEISLRMVIAMTLILVGVFLCRRGLQQPKIIRGERRPLPT